MQRWLVVLLAAFLISGCGFPQQRDSIGPPKEAYVATIIHNDILIADREVWTSTRFKRKLIQALDRFPQSHNTLQRVFLWDEIDQEEFPGAVGFYHGLNLEISLEIRNRDEDDILSTFYHELGHAIDNGLESSQRLKWQRLYTKRLHAAGHKAPKHTEWTNHVDQYTDWRGFPSAYCLHSHGEYFAEHIEEVARNLEKHRQAYPEEHSLLSKMGLLPKALIEVASSLTQRSYDESSSRGFVSHSYVGLFRRAAPGKRWRGRVLRGRPNQRTAA
jgi:hypothetical protein